MRIGLFSAQPGTLTPYCQVGGISVASVTGIPDAAVYPFVWLAKQFDNVGLWNAAAPDYIEVPANAGGAYEIAFSFGQMSSVAVGVKLCTVITVNGAVIARGASSHDDDIVSGGTLTAWVQLAPGDRVRAGLLALGAGAGADLQTFNGGSRSADVYRLAVRGVV